MNKSDIEFTVGLNTSPAEQQLEALSNKIKSKSNIVFSVKTDENGFVPNIPNHSRTTFSNNENLPTISASRQLEKLFGVFQERLNGFKYAGWSNSWDNQKRIGYDNLPTVSNSGLAEKINFVFQKSASRMRYAGSSTAESIYDDFKDLGGKKESPSSKDIKYTNQPWQEKHMAELNKKDNIELKDKLLLWGKIFGIVYSVKKLIDGLSKIWKFGAENATSVNKNINEQLGYFSVDPVGALNANVDKTRSLWYEGVRNLGENSPVSKSGLDVMSQKFTDMWTAAMSGRQVDARTTIDAQRLKEFFGFDFTVAGLLTGQREGKSATDIQRDAIIKVENQISKLAEVDAIQRGQLIDSLRNLFGDEMINAIVANFNKRLRADGYNKTVIEQIETYGDSTFGSKDLTAQTIASTNALSNLKESLADLKNTIVQETSPAFTAVTNKMAEFVDWVNKKLTSAKGEKDETGAFASMSAPEASKSAQKSYGQSKGERKETAEEIDIVEMLKNAQSIYDVADVIYKSNPLTKNVADAESIKQKRYLNELGKAIAGEDVSAYSKNEVISGLGNYEYGGKKGLEAFRLALTEGKIDLGSYANNSLLNKLFFSPGGMSNKERIAAQNLLLQIPFFTDLFNETFKEGGPEDLSADMSYGKYLLNEEDFDNPEDWYEALKSFFDSIKTNKWGKDYIKSIEYDSKKKADENKDKVLDFKEVRATFKINLTDMFGRQLGFTEQTVSTVQ